MCPVCPGALRVALAQVPRTHRLHPAICDERQHRVEDEPAVKRVVPTSRSGPHKPTEAVRVAVETVTSQVEKETGSEVDDNLRQEVEEETSDAVAKIASRRPVAEYEVVSVCREIYRKKLS